jgi:HAD superfamily hydrolase (TIGR01450 family)
MSAPLLRRGDVTASLGTQVIIGISKYYKLLYEGEISLKLEEIRLFMLDMDGTFYLGETLLPGAKEFLEECRKRKIKFTFLTNNSSKSKDDYLRKLHRLGVNVTSTEMFTSGDATLIYMKKHCDFKDILLIGTPSLETQFREVGYRLNSLTPQAVVLGFDTTITYEKLTRLCDGVRAGLPYIATHPDLNCPVTGGFIPDIGAVIEFVKASTGRKPDVVIGKPNEFIAKSAAESFGLELSQMCMVGDRLYTDIALGHCGVGTVLVMCGETTQNDLGRSEIQPDMVCDSMLELTHVLQKMPK